MFLRIALISAGWCAASFAAVRSGKAQVDWIGASEHYEVGKPVKTAIRLAVDPGWHTYWINPGEGGMKISATWELPAGWTAEKLGYPVPKRFMTGELPGFGYEGTVIFPVTFTPPAGFTGPAKLKGKISWLTCNEAHCIPGDAELELSLDAGTATRTGEAKEIEASRAKVPRLAAGALLTVEEKPKTLLLTLLVPASGLKPLGLGCTGSPKPEDYEVFPLTMQAIDSAAKFDFIARGDHWTAEVPKSEYATQPIRELTLVFAGKSGQDPVSLIWKSK